MELGTMVAEKEEDLKEQETKEYAKKFAGKLFLSIFVLPVIMWLWPSLVPFKFFELWGIKGTLGQWIFSAWPIFAWGTLVTFIHAVATRNSREVNRDAEKIIVGGTIASIVAGIFEEVTFRWLFFYLSIVTLKITNFFFFGFLGFGIPEWFQLHVFGPIVNFVTLNGLQPYLFHKSGWAVGAAIIAANAFFRDGHKYLGSFGFINSWFIGIFLFWIMFQYGLLAAIVAHFIYDFLVFSVRYVDAAIERKLGWI